ncbi:PH domain-containing protein [Actinotignum sanguinis]|uniref:PH domain-containing protein n=1 Tax=Actinotignum sanguinis TaxID=1445614 RepID=UPI00237ED60F|nr:PH domain-containing protein [Actinotignum sanguinis]MDE1553806.1 PH domain-containing protein [Actinotignum sanguinis]MDE1565612.1 PH domain-containing protein [Actinotignum sanguinis]MDE1642680.1 PH domain-containing protein [Actinotignum sanguinis]MDK8287686.1 PH domain-containing protein [Actinotignum sanguinis]MDK8353650.1 PH domain-containing protein [Actinotignum sanguinis]
MEAARVAAWVFMEETPIPADVVDLLTEGEEPYAAYKTLRDSAIFTSKRLIVRDAQGITGKKVEIYSLPYKAIQMWSSENAGKIDISAEIEMWTLAGHIKISLGRHIDVRRIDKLIARCVLGAR